ncbi:MAG: dTDP-4-dehydrorhamnose reductase [Desulfuromonadales bacterium]|nr:dTDP-4-dehydrorhamnose reductase [Desulfuromonadales bacterium]
MTRVALIGANGMLAAAIQKLAPVDYRIQLYDLPDFDLTDREQVLLLRGGDAPDIIINCAAFTNVDGCEEQHELAMRVNGDGPGILAELAKMIGAVLVHVSTDFVFDGSKGSPYLEEDQPQPLSVYGKSKLSGEQQIQQSGLAKYFIVRTGWLYGAGGNNFVETMIRLAKGSSELKIVADQRGTPTWTEDLAGAIFELLSLTRHSPYGIYHFSNDGACSWYEFACEIIDQVGELEELLLKEVLPIPTTGYPLPAERPKYSVLSKEKIKQATGLEIPPWQQSLKTYLTQR